MISRIALTPVDGASGASSSTSRKRLPFEPLDQVHLPERPVHVELVAVKPRDEARPSSRCPPRVRKGGMTGRGSRGRRRAPGASPAGSRMSGHLGRASGFQGGGTERTSRILRGEAARGSRPGRPGGSVNSKSPPTCIGVSRDSIASQAASRGATLCISSAHPPFDPLPSVAGTRPGVGAWRGRGGRRRVPPWSGPAGAPGSRTGISRGRPLLVFVHRRAQNLRHQRPQPLALRALGDGSRRTRDLLVEHLDRGRSARPSGS